MTTKLEPPPKLRIVLEFQRADQPRLYDDLTRFPKGVRRVNRLRFLAQDGLALERQLDGRRLDGAMAPRHPLAAEGAAGPGLIDDIFLHDDG